MFGAKTPMFIRLGLFGLFVGLVFAAAAQDRPVPVDLELAFVVDQSGSIDEAETMLQRQGYARALTDPVVLRGITGGMLRSIAVAYIEFAAETCEQLSVPWTRIDGPGAAKAFAGRILALPIEYCPGGNAVGDALASPPPRSKPTGSKAPAGSSTSPATGRTRWGVPSGRRAPPSWRWASPSTVW